MASERFIDLQLIKPLSKGSGNKGKISLTQLFKEQFNKLNVGYLDPCCPEDSPGAFGCPAISSDEDNIIECRDNGLYATAGGGAGNAINGLSVSSSNIVLGQDLNEVGDPALLTSNREIPMDGFSIQFTDGTNNPASIIYAPKFEATDLSDGGTPASAFRVNRTLTTISASAHGFRDQTIFNRPTFAYCAFDGAMNTGISGNHDHLVSFQARQNYASSGTLNDNYGGVSILTMSGGGNITRAYGWDHWDITGTGVVDNQFGFHVQELSFGQNNWAFYSAGNTPSALEGSLAIGMPPLTAASEKLELVGNIKLTENIYFNKTSGNNEIRPVVPRSDSYSVIIQGNINIDNDTNGGAAIEVHADTGSVSGGRINYFAYGRQGTASSGSHNFYTRSGVNSIELKMNIDQKGVAVGGFTASAALQIKAGTAVAGTAPLKFTSGTLLTTPEVGAIEFLTDKSYLTITTGAARKEFTLNDTALTSTRIPFATTNGRLTDSDDFKFITGTRNLLTYGIKVSGQTTAGDGFPAGVTTYARTATVSNNQYSYGIQEYSFVTANAGFRGYLGVQSWPYVTGATPGGVSGKFAGYVTGFSTAPIWDGSIGGAQQLPTMIGLFSALQTQAGGILSSYDVYASEINTVGGTTLNPAVVNHYALYAEPFVYATNNYGVYINGIQKNYFGGEVVLGTYTSEATSALTINSTTKGFLPSRMTTTQKNAIVTPATGLVLYDTTLNKLCVYTGSAWETVTSV
jgi:hypothetical protein